MKIEAGKFYRTRDGGKAEILTVRSNLRHPVIGLLGEGVFTYDMNGFFLSESTPDSVDLVAEWVEVPKLLAYMNYLGQIFLLKETSDTLLVRVPHLDPPEQT